MTDPVTHTLEVPGAVLATTSARASPRAGRFS
jgi:hypothetical protein